MKKKKVLSVLASAAMVTSLVTLPTNVSAISDADASKNAVTYQSVLATDRHVKNYQELTEAVAALQDGDTIVLDADIEIDSSVVIYAKQNVTFNLNNHKLTGSESFQKNDIKEEDWQNAVFNIKNCTGFVIKNGTLVAGPNNKHVLNCGDSTATRIIGVTLDHSKAYEGAPLVMNSSEVTLEESLNFITGETSWYAINVDKGTPVLKFDDNCTLNIQGPKNGLKVEEDNAKIQGIDKDILEELGGTDKVKGFGYVIAETKTPETSTNGEVTVTLTFNCQMASSQNQKDGWTRPNTTNYYVLEKTFTENTTETFDLIPAKDLGYSPISYTVVVDNIDKDVPEFNSVTLYKAAEDKSPTELKGSWSNERVFVKVNVTDASGIDTVWYKDVRAQNPEWKEMHLNSSERNTYYQYFDSEGTYDLRFKARDIAGNEIEFKNKTGFVVDKTAPTIDLVEENYLGTDVKVYDEFGVKKVTINGVDQKADYERDWSTRINGNISREASYEIVVTDPAGNATTKTVTVKAFPALADITLDEDCVRMISEIYSEFLVKDYNGYYNDIPEEREIVLEKINELHKRYNDLVTKASLEEIINSSRKVTEENVNSDNLVYLDDLAKALQEKYDTATANGAWEFEISKSVVEKELARIEQVKQYHEIVMGTYNEILGNANTLLKDELKVNEVEKAKDLISKLNEIANKLDANLTKTESLTLTNRANALQTAIDELLAAKKALQDKVDEAVKIDSDKYTKESVKVLTEALENAKKALANGESSKSDFNKVLSELIKAIDGLVETIPWTDIKPSTPVDEDKDIPWTDLEPSTPVEEDKEVVITPDPDKPTTPVKPIEKPDDKVDTGDESNIELYTSICALAVVGAGIVLAKRKKEELTK